MTFFSSVLALFALNCVWQQCFGVFVLIFSCTVSVYIQVTCFFTVLALFALICVWQQCFCVFCYYRFPALSRCICKWLVYPVLFELTCVWKQCFGVVCTNILLQCLGVYANDLFLQFFDITCTNLCLATMSRCFLYQHFPAVSRCIRKWLVSPVFWRFLH